MIDCNTVNFLKKCWVRLSRNAWHQVPLVWILKVTCNMIKEGNLSGWKSLSFSKNRNCFFPWNQKILFGDSTIRACLASLRQQMNKLMQMMPGLSLFMGMSWPFFIRCLKYLDFLKKRVSIFLVVQKKLFFLVIHNTWHARPCYPSWWLSWCHKVYGDVEGLFCLRCLKHFGFLKPE